jgi:hypothetical protein
MVRAGVASSKTRLGMAEARRAQQSHGGGRSVAGEATKGQDRPDGRGPVGRRLEAPGVTGGPVVDSVRSEQVPWPDGESENAGQAEALVARAKGFGHEAEGRSEVFRSRSPAVADEGEGRCKGEGEGRREAEGRREGQGSGSRQSVVETKGWRSEGKATCETHDSRETEDAARGREGSHKRAARAEPGRGSWQAPRRRQRGPEGRWATGRGGREARCRQCRQGRRGRQCGDEGGSRRGASRDRSSGHRCGADGGDARRFDAGVRPSAGFACSDRELYHLTPEALEASTTSAFGRNRSVVRH